VPIDSLLYTAEVSKQQQDLLKVQKLIAMIAMQIKVLILKKMMMMMRRRKTMRTLIIIMIMTMLMMVTN
jgi:hypothetical protein